MHERYMKEWIEHDLTGGARPTLVPNIISYSVIHSALRLPICQQYLTIVVK